MEKHSLTPHPYSRQHLLQGGVGIGLAKAIFFQLQFPMLHGGNSQSVDVANGTVRQPQQRKNTQLNILFMQTGKVFTHMMIMVKKAKKNGMKEPKMIHKKKLRTLFFPKRKQVIIYY